MSAFASGVEGLTRGWAWLYTLGLAAELRRDRRAELDSDLWEQRDTARARGVPSTRITASILGRCLLGVPADLSWRAEQSRAAGLPGAALRLLVSLLQGIERSAVWVERRGLPGFTVILGGLYALLGVVIIATIPINDGADATPGQLLAFGLISLAAAGAIVAGSRRIEARPVLGALLIGGGAGVMGLVLLATVVAPLAAAAVLFSALRRAVAGRRRRMPVEG